VPGERIHHVWGLRQGDPTSPMLFVAIMEVLTALIGQAVQDNLMQNLAGISAHQRVSLYADDVVLFFRPEEQELMAIKQILRIFGEASGLRVNYGKTTATLIRCGEEAEIRVKKVLGCEIANFPIVYLGLKLALRPLTKSEWHPMLDRVLQCMSAWYRGLMDGAGRLILIKVVVFARPIHLLLIADPLAWLLDEITKWARAFF
jgi:hypothetical protein